MTAPLLQELCTIKVCVLVRVVVPVVTVTLPSDAPAGTVAVMKPVSVRVEGAVTPLNFTTDDELKSKPRIPTEDPTLPLVLCNVTNDASPKIQAEEHAIAVSSSSRRQPVEDSVGPLRQVSRWIAAMRAVKGVDDAEHTRLGNFENGPAARASALPCHAIEIAVRGQRQHERLLAVAGSIEAVQKRVGTYRTDFVHDPGVAGASLFGGSVVHTIGGLRHSWRPDGSIGTIEVQQC